MKYLRRILLGLGIALLFIAVLLWFLPARWLLPVVTPHLHGVQLQQVRGTVWKGRVERVLMTDSGITGQLKWQLSRRAVLGQLQLQLDFQAPSLSFSSEIRRLPDAKLALRKGRFDTDLSAWGAQLTSPLGVPGGDLHVLVDQAVLQGGWPLELQASAHWQQAFVRTAKGEIALGDWHVHAQARQGVIEAQFEDDGVGPLQGNGQLQLSVLGWRFEATLKPRHANLALRQWLQQLGKPAADGSVHIQHRGGLGA